jgi:hypothetical protein
VNMSLLLASLQLILWDALNVIRPRESRASHRMHQGSGSRCRVRLQNVSSSGSCQALADEQPEAGMSDELTDEVPIRSGSVAGLLADQRVALLACGMQRPPAGGWPHRVLAITRRRMTRGTGQSRHRRRESAAFVRTFSRCRDRADPLVIREFGVAAGSDLGPILALTAEIFCAELPRGDSRSAAQA